MSTIALLVLGLGWWFWPRVDQRFVGTWAHDELSLKMAGNTGFTFFNDGTGYARRRNGEKSRIRWWTHGDVLLFEGAESRFGPFIYAFNYCVNRLTGRGQVRGRGVALFTTHVEADRFSYKYRNGKQFAPEPRSPVMTLVRVSE